MLYFLTPYVKTTVVGFIFGAVEVGASGEVQPKATRRESFRESDGPKAYLDRSEGS